MAKSLLHYRYSGCQTTRASQCFLGQLRYAMRYLVPVRTMLVHAHMLVLVVPTNAWYDGDASEWVWRRSARRCPAIFHHRRLSAGVPWWWWHSAGKVRTGCHEQRQSKQAAGVLICSQPARSQQPQSPISPTTRGIPFLPASIAGYLHQPALYATGISPLQHHTPRSLSLTPSP